MKIAAMLAFALGVSIAQEATRSAKQQGVYTREQAERGRAEYSTHCGSCHKEDMSGTTEAPPVFGDKFMTAWQDSNVNDLYELVRGTMPYDSPNSLTPKVYADIVAAMLQRNGFPAGAEELRPNADVLKSLALK